MPELPQRRDLELLQGAIDIHIHHGPDLYPRIQDPIELAQDAKAAGMRAVCLKTHAPDRPDGAAGAEDRARHRHLRQHRLQPGSRRRQPERGRGCAEIRGASDLAPDHRLHQPCGRHRLGRPTRARPHHQGGISEFARTKQRLFLLKDDGTLVPELHTIFDMVAAADVILNLGHISFAEMKAIVPKARQQGVKRIVCDHPFFSHLSLAQQGELADQGVWIKLTAGELLPRWWRVSVADFAAAIRHVGVKRSVISSDCGQLHNPPMVEALRITCQLLLEEEFTVDEMKTLLHHNPAQLLYP